MKSSNNYKILILCASFIASFGFANIVQAAPASMVAWDAKTRQILKNADIKQGEKLSKTCVFCHGEDGSNPSDLLEGFPSLAGQRAEYIYKQMMDYKQGKRVGLGIMPNFAALLDKQSIASIAVWFANQKLPNKVSEPYSKAAEKLVNKGDSSRFVPACAGCHGLSGEGSIVDVPALAGMNANYFKTTMNGFKNYDRKNDIYKRMRLIALKLSDKEINDLAHYYSSMGE